MEKIALANGSELTISSDDKTHLSVDEAIKLFSNEGLLLGNYHYDVDRYEKENGDVEVYLTRYYEECENCPLFEGSCQGDVPPFPNDKYPCHDMKPIVPYEEQGYEFYDINDIEEHSELTDLDKEAIRMIWTNWEEVEKILYSPNK
jgi:hypothetical protein